MNVPFAVILCYMLLLVGLGFWSNRRLQNTGEDFFVASRTIGPFLLLMSLFGTNMTTFAILGSSGEAYHEGIGVFGLMASSSSLVIPCVFFFIGTRVWALGKRLGDSGVAVSVLPATDLFNNGRHQDHSVIRGVADANALIEYGGNCAISSNNVMNPFTPFGDCSLIRIANMYANVVQHGTTEELGVCFEMVTNRAARILRLDDYGIVAGASADLVVWNAASPAEAIATIAPPLRGFKRGRRTFTRDLPELHRP